MTEQKITMTMEQVEQEMEEYRRIFDVVRLIEEETIQMMEEGREKEVDPEKVACYSFWKKTGNVRTVYLQEYSGKRTREPNWSLWEKIFIR
ncbi:MAG: hypothetical protein ACLSHW_07950 [Lachnospiraceae bacterium]